MDGCASLCPSLGVYAKSLAQKNKGALFRELLCGVIEFLGYCFVRFRRFSLLSASLFGDVEVTEPEVEQEVQFSILCFYHRLHERLVTILIRLLITFVVM